MKIAFLGAKGGVGKTMIAVNLVAIANQSNYLDCDIEKPNGYLVFNPRIIDSQSIDVHVLRIQRNRCNLCLKCINVCQYGALSLEDDRIRVDDSRCLFCTSCIRQCPNKALRTVRRCGGKIELGFTSEAAVKTGFLLLHNAPQLKIVRSLLESEEFLRDGATFIDGPSGTGDVVKEMIKAADYCVLIVESTRFEQRDFSALCRLVEDQKKPFGVIINKCGDQAIEDAKKHCRESDITLLLEIPYDRRLSEIFSNGSLIVAQDTRYRHIFSTLLKKIEREVRNETSSLS